jgi:hypothetical protein
MTTNAINALQTDVGFVGATGYESLMILLHQAQSHFRLRTVGPINMAIGQGRVFEYFDELRKILELANEDVFFVDPYVDAEFVSRYLPLIRDRVTIRLLTGKGSQKAKQTIARR